VFDWLDQSVAEELEVDVEIYCDIIENKCTYSEAKFIILASMSGREDKIIKAKELIKSKIQ
jgi:hypothetical protein